MRTVQRQRLVAASPEGAAVRTLLDDSLAKQVPPGRQPVPVTYPFTSLARELTDVRGGINYALNGMETGLGILTTPAVNALSFYEGTAPMNFLRERLRVLVSMQRLWGQIGELYKGSSDSL